MAPATVTALLLSPDSTIPDAARVAHAGSGNGQEPSPLALLYIFLAVLVTVLAATWFSICAPDRRRPTLAGTAPVAPAAAGKRQEPLGPAGGRTAGPRPLPRAHGAARPAGAAAPVASVERGRKGATAFVTGTPRFCEGAATVPAPPQAAVPPLWGGGGGRVSMA
ncbi:uncharacterized protein BXZ73DRAFT_82383 [Epithele typhae]|uniref:uncharacterized protein n=1 Tax=Epithele typhae TaxID=378194 RepID=UPI002007C4D9|nr:uncharacterized protein BXZ73DRAFT_82383 [Epithele typhae]KAH9912308.1 hypothetical protein BXZ73DRAFT_82383 [Epithele typhae]